MSTYTVNVIHKKWYSLQSFLHINRKQKSPTSSSSSASSTLSNVIHIPPFQSDTKVIQSQQLQASRCKLPSGKLPRRRNLTNSSLHRKTVKQYQQQMMSKIIYNCCTRGFHIQLLHNHTHFSGYSSAVTCNVCHFVITTAIATRGKPYTNNKNQIKHIINSSSPPDIRAHTH